MTTDYPHEVYCNADRDLEIGCPACSCRAGREIKRLRNALQKIANLPLVKTATFKRHPDPIVRATRVAIAALKLGHPPSKDSILLKIGRTGRHCE